MDVSRKERGKKIYVDNKSYCIPAIEGGVDVLMCRHLTLRDKQREIVQFSRKKRYKLDFKRIKLKHNR